MRDPQFGLALAAKTLLVMGFFSQTVLFAILTFDVTGSSFWAGAVTATQLIPQFLFAFLSGHLSDRRGPMLPIFTGALCAGSSCFALATWFSLGGASDVSNVVALLICAALSGLGVALASTAIQAIAPRLVSRAEVSTAVSLNFLPTAVSRAGGPILASLLMLTVGSVVSLSCVGTACFAAGGMFLFVRALSGGARPAGQRNSIREVFGLVAHDRRLVVVLFGTAAVGAAAEFSISLAPALSATYRIGAQGAGWVSGAFGVGALLGVVVFTSSARFVRPMTGGCVALALLGGSVVLIGVFRSVVVVTVLLVVAGMCMVQGMTAFSVAAQTRTPLEFLGRVMALWTMANSGGKPVASMALGFFADHFSVSAALVLSGGITVAAAAVCAIAWRRAGRA